MRAGLEPSSASPPLPHPRSEPRGPVSEYQSIPKNNQPQFTHFHRLAPPHLRPPPKTHLKQTKVERNKKRVEGKKTYTQKPRPPQPHTPHQPPLLPLPLLPPLLIPPLHPPLHPPHPCLNPHPLPPQILPHPPTHHPQHRILPRRPPIRSKRRPQPFIHPHHQLPEIRLRHPGVQDFRVDDGELRREIAAGHPVARDPDYACCFVEGGGEGDVWVWVRVAGVGGAPGGGGGGGGGGGVGGAGVGVRVVGGGGGFEVVGCWVGWERRGGMGGWVGVCEGREGGCHFLLSFGGGGSKKLVRRWWED